MALKSIENFGRVDLTNCDQEPIHIPGSIQPHGFLLALDKDYVVKFCSANIPLFGFTIESTLNKNIYNVFPAIDADALASYLSRRVFESSRPHVAIYNGVSFNTTVHATGDYFILEFEPFPDGSLELSELYLQTQKFTTILSKAIGLKQLCQHVSEEVKEITGYDRVMIYRFDEQYNGEVIAEAVNADLEPFLGLHYPHTDIPVQARQLYLRNLMRMITDVNYAPVPLLTMDAAMTNNSLDLSNSILRSVSPIHIEYLQNMGVSATLTISLIAEGRLWGLIACHHYSAKNIPHYIRLSSLLQGHFLTSQIKVQEVNAEFELKIALEAHLKNFLAQLDLLSLSQDENVASPELLDLTNAHGVFIKNNGSTQHYGLVPPPGEIRALLSHSEIKDQSIVFSSNVSKDFGITFSNGIAGIAYYSLAADDCIIWFRNELKREIIWAGDPTKAIVKDQKGLSPRKSFELWKQMLTGQCSEWQPAEKTVASQCVYAIQKHFSYLNDKKIQKTQSDLLKELNELNEELENINWISTHDLKEPLRKIRLFASMINEGEKYEFNKPTQDMINKMDASARKMQRLITDLTSFARIKNGAYDFELTDLDTIVDPVIAECKESHPDMAINFNVDKLPQIYCLPLLMGQLFANLISNAVKFARPDVPLVISITSKDIQKDGRPAIELVIADNGIGFDNRYKNTIFRVFQRLEIDTAAEGTGIGLAICKKIVGMHKGTIDAEGALSKGARFIMHLPYRPNEEVG